MTHPVEEQVEPIMLELSSEFQQDGAFQHLRVLVHTARRGSGGTDAYIYVFFKFLLPDDSAFHTEWLRMNGSNGDAFEQGMWDDLWFFQEIPAGARLTGWVWSLSDTGSSSDKWSHDRLTVYGRRIGTAWTSLGGCDHGESYYTLDAIGSHGDYVTPESHTYYSDGMGTNDRSGASE